MQWVIKLLSKNILHIHCSLSTVLKEESLSATERECKKCISFIIDQLEFDFTVELNQIHSSTILYAQKLNMTSLNLNIFLSDLKVHNFYYLYIKIDDSEMIQVFNSTISQSNDLWKRERYYRLFCDLLHLLIKTYRNWSDEGLSILCNTLLKENKLGKQGKINVTYGQQN